MSIPTVAVRSLASACALLAAGCTLASNDPPPAMTAATLAPAASPASTQATLLARGEYLVRIAGCNDCHTAGYAERQGQVPASEWLQGSPLGYRGPWGTTYATNLRLRLADMDEAQWMTYSATLRTRPLMPDFVLRGMEAGDRRAIYHFIRSLGPAGAPAPAALPPGATPPPPYMDLVTAAPPT